MALADVLSAVRELVLDEGPPAADVTERRSALARRFRRLTPTELADLAAVPPDRLRIYTELAFAGQRSMLRWVYPMSLAAIAILAQDATDTRPAGEIEFELVRELHRWHPWHSASTRDLAAGFRRFITQQRTDLCTRWPGLADLIAYERCELDVFYALDFPGRPLVAGELAALSVGELMAVSVARPPYVESHDFHYNVLSIVDVWQQRQELPRPLPGPAACPAVCGRSVASLMPAWVRLSPADWVAFSVLEPGVPTPLNDVAAAYVGAQPGQPVKDELAAFADFFAILLAWSAAGVLLRPEAT
jgi:hypothetical protein